MTWTMDERATGFGAPEIGFHDNVDEIEASMLAD